MKIAVVLIVFLFPALVHAWNEPADFMGVPFNKNIEQTLQKCPFDFFHRETTSFKEKCWTNDFGYILHNFELGPAAPFVSGTQYVNKLGRITMIVLNSYFSIVYAIMEEKYGKPTTVENLVWISQGGITLPNKVARWIGQDLIIEAR